MPPTPVIAAIDVASPAMLGWAAAAALPWLVNLWSRRRHVDVSWAASELLMTAVRQRSRRLKLRELLLLSLRAAILLLAALAAAQPRWHAAGSTGQAARIHHVLVVDQSSSMASQMENGTRLESAKRQAARIVRDAPAGDAFSVIGWAADAENVLGRPAFDEQPALAAIASLEAADTTAQIASAQRTVEAAISDARKNFPDLASRIVFLSDLAANTWSPARSLPTEQGNEVSQAWKRLSEGAAIALVNVDETRRSNLAVTAVRVDPAAPIINEPMTVAVDVEGFGTTAPVSARLELLVDGKPSGVQDAALQPRQKRVVSFQTRLALPGGHVVQALLRVDGDPLPRDDSRWLSVEALRVQKALCIADRPGQAIDVARALNPRFDQPAPTGRIKVDIAGAASISATDLSQYDAAFVCNVAELTPRDQRLLIRYATAGGALAILLGDRVRPACYNELFSQVDPLQAPSGPLVPLSIAAAPAGGQWRLDPLGYRHPIAAPFAGRPRSGLAAVRVSRYFPVQVLDAARVEIPLALDSGDPAMIVADCGRGRAAVVTVNPALQSAGEPWSSLAVSPSFVPLMRKLFQHLTTTRRAERLNRLAGEPLPDEGIGSWTNPDGQLTTPPGDTRQAGVYHFAPRGTPTPGPAAGRQSLAVAINVDPRESDLSFIEVSEVGGLLRDPEEQASVIGSPGAGRPLAGYLLALAAVLSVLESTAAWLLGRGSA
ncbi:MAG: VWA domain-containing protein [Pirellulales bacterium]|nr:VWA domain-containing protein [Pirellulales bacterium]